MLPTPIISRIWPELLTRPADKPVSQADRDADAALVADLRRDLASTQELSALTYGDTP